MLELTDIKTCDLLDLFKSVYKSVSVNEKLPACFGNVEVVFKEALNGEQGLLVEALNGAALEHFLEEHLAQGGGQLIDQAGDAEVVIADDGALGVEHLGDLQRGLGFLKGARRSLIPVTVVPMPTTQWV